MHFNHEAWAMSNDPLTRLLVANLETTRFVYWGVEGGERGGSAGPLLTGLNRKGQLLRTYISIQNSRVDFSRFEKQKTFYFYDFEGYFKPYQTNTTAGS